MKLITLVIAAGLLASPALAQTPASPSEIVVLGYGTVERPADWAAISFQVRGEGATSVEALRSLQTQRQVLEDSLGRLAGARAIKIEALGLKVVPVRGAGCESNPYDNPVLSKGECAIAGHLATLNFKVRLAPADKAGDAASLAAQLGAVDVELAGSGLDQADLLSAEATTAAIAKARTDALVIARASGRTLGPIVRVQNPNAGMEFGGAPALDAVAKPAALFMARPPVAPAVAVAITVPPITETSRLIVVFRLKP